MEPPWGHQVLTINNKQRFPDGDLGFAALSLKRTGKACLGMHVRIKDFKIKKKKKEQVRDWKMKTKMIVPDAADRLGSAGGRKPRLRRGPSWR